MSCHLACPTCQKKIFKISNMSIQNFRRDMIKQSGASQKLRTSVSSELDTALRYNVQLEKENKALRGEIYDLATKNQNLLEALDNNKGKFEGDFSKLQDEIRINEKKLVENTKKCIEQQKKYAQEIKKLKLENEQLEKEKQEIEKMLTENLKSVESELKIMKLENENLKSSNKENDEKCIKYKTKLRHAVQIVNELNQIVAQYGKKPEIISETTQTDLQKPCEKTTLDCSQCGDPRYKRNLNLNTENLLLSDIFFKPKSFMDSEIELFSSKSKTRCPFK